MFLNRPGYFDSFQWLTIYPEWRHLKHNTTQVLYVNIEGAYEEIFYNVKYAVYVFMKDCYYCNT